MRNLIVLVVLVGLLAGCVEKFASFKGSSAVFGQETKIGQVIIPDGMRKAGTQKFDIHGKPAEMAVYKGRNKKDMLNVVVVESQKDDLVKEMPGKILTEDDCPNGGYIHCHTDRIGCIMMRWYYMRLDSNHVLLLQRAKDLSDFPYECWSWEKGKLTTMQEGVLKNMIREIDAELQLVPAE